MSILLWIIIGGISGWIASMIMGTNTSQGTLGDIVLGVVGAVVGGIVLSFFGEPGVTGFNLYSMFVAILGSVLVIGLGRMITPSRR